MRLQKKLVFHIIVVSLILSGLYSAVFTSVNGFLVYRSDISDSGWFTTFIAFFLLLYLFHIVLSLIGYAIEQLVKMNYIKRIVLFNVIGVIFIIGVCLFLREGRLFILCLSLAFFSVSLLIHGKRELAS